MTYRGHIKNGVAVLDTTVVLPDGTPVRVEVDRTDSEFWRSRTVDELAVQQGVRPVADPSNLAIDWPAEDSVDEFLAFLREVRS